MRRAPGQPKRSTSAEHSSASFPKSKKTGVANAYPTLRALRWLGSGVPCVSWTRPSSRWESTTRTFGQRFTVLVPETQEKRNIYTFHALSILAPERMDANGKSGALAFSSQVRSQRLPRQHLCTEGNNIEAKNRRREPMGGLAARTARIERLVARSSLHARPRSEAELDACAGRLTPIRAYQFATLMCQIRRRSRTGRPNTRPRR